MQKYNNTRLILRLLLDFLLLCALYVTALIILPRAVPTTQRGFHCNDRSLQYPYAAELLNSVHLTLLAIALPAAVLLVVEMLRAVFVCDRAATPAPVQLLFGLRIPTFVSECYKLIGVYLFGFALQLIATETLKRTVGRLRPYFFDVCQPQAAEGNPCAGLTTPRGYIQNYNCTELVAPGELLLDMRHSFPSGYAAATAYAMCFIVLYLQARVTVDWLRLPRATMQFGCALLTLLVALERVSSFRSHGADVIVGLVLGTLIAYGCAHCVAQLFPLAWRAQRVRRHREPNGEYVYGNVYGYGNVGGRGTMQYYN